MPEQDLQVSPLKWFRLYSEFAHDPKMQSLSEAMQRRFIMLLCFHASGELQKWSNKQISHAMRISEKEWQKTLKNFKECSFIDDDLNILNWNKRQGRRDHSRARVQAHRQRLKEKQNQECNADVTVTVTHGNAPRVREEKEKEIIASVYQDKRSERARDTHTFFSILENLLGAEAIWKSGTTKVAQMCNYWEAHNVTEEHVRACIADLRALDKEFSVMYLRERVVDYAMPKPKKTFGTPVPVVKPEKISRKCYETGCTREVMFNVGKTSPKFVCEHHYETNHRLPTFIDAKLPR